jgi:ABC-2 type transport system permease protein
MRAFIAFSKKELRESIKTYRTVILVGVLAAFGIMSPLIAMLLPQILAGAELAPGMAIELPEPTAIDSWMQFFGNVGQMGMLAVMLIFAGITASELSKGTLLPLLTKGLSRSTVVISKFVVALGLWTLAYLTSLVIALSYTAFYWDPMPLPHAFLAFAGPWVYGSLLIALLILGGIVIRGQYGSLMFTGSTVLLMALINIWPAANAYNPSSLAANTLGLIMGQNVPSDFVPAIIVALVAIIACLAASVLAFNKKEL